MCGIAGILNLRHADAPLAGPLQAMTKRMAHRGPDDEGYLLAAADGTTNPFYGNDSALPGSARQLPKGFPGQHVDAAGNGFLALGHRRLSIIDLSEYGHQPMCTADGRYWVVFNGEIYNFRDIAADLRREGVVLHGHSDTEVLINAYALWGPRCLDRFNGMFAFAIWDNSKRQLFCARDRIGIKPFYYSVRGDNFVFASDIKTLLASGLCEPEPDPEGLYLAMAYGIAPRPKTAFRGIRSLPQAHWMLVDERGDFRSNRYWSIPIGSQDRTMTRGDAADLLEEQLRASVERRLVADVPVGTFMSGGIDSTTISAIASTLHPGIEAFTLAFEETAPELDEVPQATATARMYDMKHVVHRVQAAAALDRLDQWIEGYEEPYYGFAANHVISEVVAGHGVKVILNGLGGDELFAGYSWYRNLDHWKTARRLGPLLWPLASGLRGRWKLLAESSRIRSADRLHSFLFRRNSDYELRELFTDKAAPQWDSIELVHDAYVDDICFDDDIEALSFMDLMNYIGNHHVHRIDQFTMAHSIEGRFPFLDHELVEAAFRIPSHLKRDGKVQKLVVRDVAKKYIAPECLAMTKKGFSMPVRQWLEGPLHNVVDAKLPALALRDTISGDAVRKWHSEYRQGQRDATKLWHLVALELWYEKFIDAAR
jgi:asparagine synthase (glutamine-hydrolysing)